MWIAATISFILTIIDFTGQTRVTKKLFDYLTHIFGRFNRKCLNTLEGFVYSKFTRYVVDLIPIFFIFTFILALIWNLTLLHIPSLRYSAFALGGMLGPMTWLVVIVSFLFGISLKLYLITVFLWFAPIVLITTLFWTLSAFFTIINKIRRGILGTALIITFAIIFYFRFGT